MLIKSFFVIPIVLASVGLSFWVLLSDKKSRANQLMFLEVNLIVLSLFLDYLTGFLSNTQSLYLMRLSYVFFTLAVTTFYFFVYFFLWTKKSRPIINFAVLLLSLIMCVAITTTSIIVASIQHATWGNQIVIGDFVWVYYLFIILLLSVAFVALLRKYSQSGKIDRQKIRFMIVGMALYVVLQIIFNLILPTVGIQSLYYLGDYSIIVFIAFTAYAIIKHQLFDVRLAIVRSVSYSLLLGSLAAVYAVITYGLSAVFSLGQVSSPAQIALNITTSLLLVVLFQPLRKFFDRTTNKVFYKGNYNTDDFIGRVNNTLAVTTDLRALLERTSYEMASTLKAEQAFFFIFTTAEGNYLMAGTDGHNHLPKHDAILVEQKCGGKDDIVEASSLSLTMTPSSA